MAEFSQAWEADQSAGACGRVGSVVETDFAVTDTRVGIEGKIGITRADNTVGWTGEEVDSASFRALVGTAVGGWDINSGIFFDFDFQFRVKENWCGRGSSADHRSGNGDKESDSWSGRSNSQTDFFSVGSCKIGNVNIINSSSIDFSGPFNVLDGNVVE